MYIYNGKCKLVFNILMTSVYLWIKRKKTRIEIAEVLRCPQR